MEKVSSSVRAAFWLLMAAFILILGEFFIPAIRDQLRGSKFFLVPVVFSLLGIWLMFLTLRQKVKGVSKKFLIMTGASATGFLVGVVLHNGFYALGTITEHIIVLSRLTEVLGVFFFLLATLACPLGFLVGASGSIVLLVKRKKNKQ